MIKEHNGVEILGVHWFSQLWVPSLIGIVITKNGAGEVEARIGTGLSHGEDEDIKHIVEWGGKFDIKIAWKIITRPVDPEDPIMRMVEYIKDEGFPESYQKALLRITNYFNWSKESEKDIFDFVEKLNKKYGVNNENRLDGNN